MILNSTFKKGANLSFAPFIFYLSSEYRPLQLCRLHVLACGQPIQCSPRFFALYRYNPALPAMSKSIAIKIIFIIISLYPLIFTEPKACSVLSFSFVLLIRPITIVTIAATIPRPATAAQISREAGAVMRVPIV